MAPCHDTEDRGPPAIIPQALGPRPDVDVIFRAVSYAPTVRSAFVVVVESPQCATSSRVSPVFPEFHTARVRPVRVPNSRRGRANTRCLQVAPLVRLLNRDTVVCRGGDAFLACSVGCHECAERLVGEVRIVEIFAESSGPLQEFAIDRGASRTLLIPGL